MPLTGLDIYKHLPRENCKKCGVATCLAFAMKVAAGQAGLDLCPRLDDKARTALAEASAPPQQLVKIGAGDKAIEVGQETILYRHEEKFHHPTAVAVCVNDGLEGAAIEERCREVAALKFERLGATLQVDMVAVYNTSQQADTFAKAAQTASKTSGKPLALIAADPECLKAAGMAVKETRPLLWAMGAASQTAKFLAVAKELNLPICLEGDGFNALVALGEAARAEGLKEVVLSPGQTDASKTLEFLTQSRRAALLKKFRPLGFPIAVPVLKGESYQAVVEACWFILKYAALVVVNTTRPEQILSILTSRQDIYTDPQKPVQVQAGLYTIGQPGPDSPLLVTTNFALSYYSVASEVESSRVPAYILSVDTEGTSVLTAWAADKFNATTITAALKKSEIESKLPHRKMVIPGHLAVISAPLIDESGWRVQVGPKEASGLVSFLKSQWKP